MEADKKPNFEIEPVDCGPRAIFDLVVIHGLVIVDDLLYTTYDDESELLGLIESRGYRLGEGLEPVIPDNLKAQIDNFDLKRYPVIDSCGRIAAVIGVLKGGAEELDKLNTIFTLQEKLSLN